MRFPCRPGRTRRTNRARVFSILVPRPRRRPGVGQVARQRRLYMMEPRSLQCGHRRSPMSIESASDLEGLRIIGAIVAEALEEMRRRVAAGVTTADLDAVAEEVLRRRGARATPRDVYNFPAASCISVNSEAVHGVPRRRVLRDGDVVKLDLTADRDGFVADAARTVV